MANQKTGAQGTYVNVTGVIDAATKLELNAAIDAMTLLWSPATGTSASSPDFNLIPLHVREAIDREIVGVKAAIEAAPVV